MYSILEKIYIGNRGDSETVKMSEAYKKRYRKFIDLWEMFDKDLSEDKKEEFKKLFNAECDLCNESDLMKHKEGFKIGLLIGIECCLNL